MARVVVPLAIPMALGLALVIIIAVSGGPVTTINESALGSCASPAAFSDPSASTDSSANARVPAAGAANQGQAANTSGQAAGAANQGQAASADPAASAPGQAPDPAASTDPAASSNPSAGVASPAASAAPCVSALASGSALASASATATAPPVNPEAGAPDLAETNPVDPANNPISLAQTAAQAANTMNCTLIVPDNPLSAEGLATPWQLSDGCSEANPNEESFVQASILGPTGEVMVYDPLVITQGTTPAATPVAPQIPPGSEVIIEVGFNGNNLVLEGAGAAQGGCIDAFGNSIIAQTSACNASAFFADANSQIAAGRLRIPQLGTASDGQTCETTRSFSLIDQDQSDNVASEYLLNGNGQTAQDSAANKAAMGGSTVITNGSDEGLLDHFVDPALGCTPAQATDTTSANGVSGSQALNELSARQNQQGEIALLPVNDPQLLVDGQFSIGKTNTYRMLTDQPPIPANADENQMASEYCQEMVDTAPAKLQLDQAMETNFTTPVPATGDNLATFMGARLAASFTNLGCQNFGLQNPVTVTMNGNGVAIAVTYNTAQQQANMPQGAAPGSGSPQNPYNRAPAGRRGHRENGAGM